MGTKEKSSSQAGLISEEIENFGKKVAMDDDTYLSSEDTSLCKNGDDVDGEDEEEPSSTIAEDEPSISKIYFGTKGPPQMLMVIILMAMGYGCVVGVVVSFRLRRNHCSVFVEKYA